MADILITGGAGYLGHSLVNLLKNEKRVNRIVVYDSLLRQNYNLFKFGLFKSSDCKIEFICADILDQRSLSSALKDIDIVYHLAAKVNEPEGDIDSQYYEQINNWGTSVLAHEIKKTGVKKIIYASSIYVYGYSDKRKSIEDYLEPNSFYGLSKLRGENQLFSILPNNIKIDICRIGNIYGYNPSIRFDVLINKLAFEARFNKSVRIYGDGNQKRPLIHVNKCAAFLVDRLNYIDSNAVYNVVEKHISVLDILNILKKVIPDLEYIFVNRHVKMKDILVKNSKDIEQLSSEEITSNIHDLLEHLN